jgi:hypothetical protein
VVSRGKGHVEAGKNMNTILPSTALVELTDEERDAAIQKAIADKRYGALFLSPKAPPASAPATPGLLSASQLAKAIGVSVPTIGRFVTEGMPVEHVGARRKFEALACRAWLATRGKKATKAKPTTTDAIDVAEVLRRAGLQVAK